MILRLVVGVVYYAEEEGFHRSYEGLVFLALVCEGYARHPDRSEGQREKSKQSSADRPAGRGGVKNLERVKHLGDILGER